MNLRMLKKLSARAAPYLIPLGDRREKFKAVAGDNYTGIRVTDHKGEVIPYAAPLKGTIMVGASYGYFEPEWEEVTAWESLVALTRAGYMDYREEYDKPRMTRKIDFTKPGEVFRAADDLLATYAAQRDEDEEEFYKPFANQK